jgi:hypothetical protein
MPLSGLLEEASKLARGQVAAAPMARPVRALGPQAWPGRGRGIRALTDYLDALRKVEGRIGQRKELAGRLRTCCVRFRWESYFVFNRTYQTWEGSPTWYWDEADKANVEPSVYWEAVASTGYLDLTTTGPSDRVAVWPLWLVLEQPGSYRRSDYSLDPQNMPVPPFRGTQDEEITLLRLVAGAWIEWNRIRRVQRAGLPIGDWAAQERGLFDLQKLRAAVARRAPREDLMGCIDALVIGRISVGNERSSALLQDYYGPIGLNARWSNGNRLEALFATAPLGSGFHGLSIASSLNDLKGRLRPRLNQMLRKCSLFEPWWNEREIGTPWGTAALDLLTDGLAAVLAGQTSPTFGQWPSAGFGVRSFDAAHAAQPLYGNWDLQFGDDDVGSRYAGSVRAGPGGHIAALVTDLRNLGFTAPAANTTRFDARVAMAVREFQIEAAEARHSLDVGGVQHAQQILSPRRYFGRVHGIVDGETRRLIQLWLNLPTVEGDPGPLGPAGTQARNGLLVVACTPPPANSPDPRVARAVEATGGDVWGAMGNPAVVGTVWQGDTFDFILTPRRRHWAIDRLLRWGVPVVGEAPALADFGAPVPLADVDALPLGRYTTGGIGGPSMTSDFWNSTLLTWARFQDSPSPEPEMAARRNDWRVLYGMSYPETLGHEDVVNCWDIALLSFGWSHWTLVTHRHRPNPPPGVPADYPEVREMGAMLAWYRHRDPAGFHRDFGRFGLHAPTWGSADVELDSPGKHVARVLMSGAGDPTNRLDPVLQQEPSIGQWHLEHTWMRSWRWIYRVLQTARLSTSFRRANREFALRRIITFLDTPYLGGGFIGGNPRIGGLACSEQAVIALMRWHINLPGFVIRKNGNPGDRLREAVDLAATAYRQTAVPQLAAGTPIDAATLVDATDVRAVAFQNSLIQRLLEQTEPTNTPPNCQAFVQAPNLQPRTDTVRACFGVRNQPAGEVAFSSEPGSYVPPPLPATW